MPDLRISPLRISPRRLALFGMLVALFTPATSWAQRRGKGVEPPPFPFSNEKMFEAFFGGDRAGEQETLAQVEISIREEKDYGQQVWNSFQEDFKRRKISVKTRGPEVAYLGKIVGTLQPFMTHGQRYPTIQIIYADSETTDAYSIPGGTLVIFRGMLEVAGSEAALATVLGHELSHLDHGHQLLPLRRMKLTRQAANRPADPQAMFRQANVWMSAFTRPFRPEDEAQADADGATWAYQAGYDPRAVNELFARLMERDQTGRWTPSFLRTHPYHADRQVAVEAKYAQLQQAAPSDTLSLGRMNLRRRIPLSEQRFED